MIRTNQEKYWITLNDEQIDFGDFTEVSDYLIQHVGNEPMFQRAEQIYGLVCPAFPETNSIEIFIGDEDADPNRELTEAEILCLNYDVFGWIG